MVTNTVKVRPYTFKKYGHESYVTMGKRILSSRVAVNILNKQLCTANKGWSSSLQVEWSANNSSP